MEQLLPHLIMLAICVTFLKQLWNAQVAFMHAHGMYTTEEWAERLLRYSRANNYISLEDLEKCFKYRPRDERGRAIYLVHTDWWGIPLDFGLRHYSPEVTLGYCTNGHSWAQITIYSRDKNGKITIDFREVGQESTLLLPPSKPVLWRDRSWFYQGS